MVERDGFKQVQRAGPNYSKKPTCHNSSPMSLSCHHLPTFSLLGLLFAELTLTSRCVVRMMPPSLPRTTCLGSSALVEASDQPNSGKSSSMASDIVDAEMLLVSVLGLYS